MTAFASSVWPSTLNQAWAKAEVVVNLPAQTGVRYSIENPRSYVDANIVGTFNLLELMRARPVAHFMLASTSSVYGANTQMPFRENDRIAHPISLYAATKASTELIAHSYSHLWSIPTTAFRFFTVYGPWGRPDMALFKFTRAILDNEEIELYGEGRMSRDFTYVEDLVEAMLKLSAVAPSEENRVASPAGLDTLSRQAPFRIVNIGGYQVGFVEDYLYPLGFELQRHADRRGNVTLLVQNVRNDELMSMRVRLDGRDFRTLPAEPREDRPRPRREQP